MKTLMMALALAAAAPAFAPAQTNDELREQVRARETAFAKTMADRDHAAFTTFLADEAVFLGRGVLRGKAAVAEGWKRLYEAPAAPFSWRPERVEVLDSGTLAVSTGPVFAPDGTRVGQFNSTWRREPDGSWKIVLDHGCDCGPVCAAAAPAPAALPAPAARPAPAASPASPAAPAPPASPKP